MGLLISECCNGFFPLNRIQSVQKVYVRRFNWSNIDHNRLVSLMIVLVWVQHNLIGWAINLSKVKKCSYEKVLRSKSKVTSKKATSYSTPTRQSTRLNLDPFSLQLCGLPVDYHFGEKTFWRLIAPRHLTTTRQIESLWKDADVGLPFNDRRRRVNFFPLWKSRPKPQVGYRSKMRGASFYLLCAIALISNQDKTLVTCNPLMYEPTLAPLLGISPLPLQAPMMMNPQFDPYAAMSQPQFMFAPPFGPVPFSSNRQSKSSEKNPSRQAADFDDRDEKKEMADSPLSFVSSLTITSTFNTSSCSTNISSA